MRPQVRFSYMSRLPGRRCADATWRPEMTTSTPPEAPTLSPARTLLDAGWSRPLELPDDLLAAEDHRTRIGMVAATNFPVLGIPADLGGCGGDMLDMAAAQRQIALLDPGMAIGLCMH